MICAVWFDWSKKWCWLDTENADCKAFSLFNLSGWNFAAAAWMKKWLNEIPSFVGLSGRLNGISLYSIGWMSSDLNELECGMNTFLKVFFTVVVDDFEWLNYYVRTVFRFAWIFIESMNDDNLDLLFILSALYFQLWKIWSWILCYFPVYDVYEWSG